MADTKSAVTTDINIYLRQGASTFQNGRHQAAFDAFEMALKLALQNGDNAAARVCRQNMGAFFVAMCQAEKGLQHLLTALPPADEDTDPHSLGDLYFNLGIGYEMMSNLPEASRRFIDAAREYHMVEECIAQEAEAYTRSALLIQQCGGIIKAAQLFRMASDCFAKIHDFAYAATNLCHEANSLISIGCYDDALRAADECMILCQNVKNPDMKAKLYNEVGVLYSQCGEFQRAATCLELSLPKHRGEQNDKRLEAMIRQNLGAVYNCLNDYKRALPLHQEALMLQKDLSNRHAQCEIELNIAYAYAQLSDFSNAATHYDCSYQAAVDTGDKHSQWQALEGLAAAKFRLNDVASTITYYKQALHALTTSGEKNLVANERLVAKLNDVLQSKFLSGQNATKQKDDQHGKVAGANNNEIKKENQSAIEITQRSDLSVHNDRSGEKLSTAQTGSEKTGENAIADNTKKMMMSGNQTYVLPFNENHRHADHLEVPKQAVPNNTRNRDDLTTVKTEKQGMEQKQAKRDEYGTLRAYEERIAAELAEEENNSDSSYERGLPKHSSQQMTQSLGPPSMPVPNPPNSNQAPPLLVHVPANNDKGSSNRNLRTARASVESQDDPNYMSLRTLQRPPIIVEQDQPEPDPVLNTTSSQQPQRMAMPTNWSRGAQEEFLFRYQQQYSDDKRREKSAEEEVHLPSRKKQGDDQSKTCHLM